VLELKATGEQMSLSVLLGVLPPSLDGEPLLQLPLAPLPRTHPKSLRRLEPNVIGVSSDGIRDIWIWSEQLIGSYLLDIDHYDCVAAESSDDAAAEEDNGDCIIHGESRLNCRISISYW
jgi:hypothetical protein